MATTPADTPSAPRQYAAVSVTSQDIQAPQADLSAVTAAAVSVATGARQMQSETLLSGADAPSVTAGFSGGGEWPTDPR